MDTSSTSNHGSLTQYSIPAQAPGVGHIVSGPDGNLWFQNGFNSNYTIVKMNTDGVVLAQYPTPSYYVSALISGPNGVLWATGPAGSGRQALLSITTAGTISNYDLPAGYNIGSNYGCLTMGPDGNLWFYAIGPDGNVIGSMTPTGTFSWYPLDSGMAIDQSSLVTGSDGNLWFCATISGTPDQAAVCSITLTGTITTYTVPADYVSGYTSNIASGLDGNLWFTGGDNSNNPYIGSSTTSGTITTYSLPSGYDSYADGAYVFLIISGPDENLWFCGQDNNASNYLASITTDGVITIYPLYTTSILFSVNTLAVGPDRNLWLSQGGGVAARFTI